MVSGQFTKSELPGIVVNAFKSEFATELFEIEIVALGDGIRHVHAEAGQLHWRVARNETFTQRCQGNRNLNGGAGLSTRGKRELLVDHGKDAAIRWIDDHCCPVHVAQRVNRGLADYWIFSSSDVAGKDVAFGK